MKRPRSPVRASGFVVSAGSKAARPEAEVIAACPRSRRPRPRATRRCGPIRSRHIKQFLGSGNIRQQEVVGADGRPRRGTPQESPPQRTGILLPPVTRTASWFVSSPSRVCGVVASRSTVFGSVNRGMSAPLSSRILQVVEPCVGAERPFREGVEAKQVPGSPCFHSSPGSRGPRSRARWRAMP